MEPLNSLKNRFISIRRSADGAFARQDYSSAMESYASSADVLDEIYNRETSAKEKQEYLLIAKELQARYDECKRNLGLKVELHAGEPPKRPTPKKAPKETKQNRPIIEPEEDDTQYEFEIGGDTINVRSFLGDSSDLKDVYFDDVVGMAKQKRIATKEFFASDSQRAFREKLKAKPKNFILLYGLPGTGKTYFAIALSNELKRFHGDNVPFVSIIGSTLKSGTPGLMEKNIKAVFEYAKQFDRCVLFLDEFDSIAMSRQKNTGDPTDRAAVTTLIQLLGGFCSNPNLLVLAATNTPYDIDGAILSRASLKFEVPLPSSQVLEGVLEKGLGEICDNSVDLGEVAKTLEKKHYSNRDCAHLIELAKDLLDDAHENDGSVESLNGKLLEEAIASFHPSYVASEAEKLAEFSKSNE